MTDVYLITGFLGAGKTTFLKNVVNVLGKDKIHIIVNEFGKAGIDGTLIQKTGLWVKEINNGSIFCTCRLEQFGEALEQSLEQMPGAILVEASGLSDPENIRRILEGIKDAHRIHYAGAWCLIDALNFKKVFQTAAAVRKQIAVSDVFIVNKTDLVEEADWSRTGHLLHELRPDARLFFTAHGRVEADWLLPVPEPGAEGEGRGIYHADLSAKSYLLEIKDGFGKEEFEEFLRLFLKDTYRVKGFARLDGRIYLADCTGEDLKLSLYEGSPPGVNRIVILSGTGLPAAKSIRMACERKPEKIAAFI